MTLSLSELADKLSIASITWSIKRNDELSGLGDGRVWQAELAPPIWEAEVSLNPMYNSDAKEIAALIRKLQGAQESFWLYDPLSRFPRNDPDGTLLGSATPSIRVVPDRNRIGLKGLPPLYKLVPGDKIQIAYGSNSERSAFLEVGSSVTANRTTGDTAAFEVFPPLPTGIVVGLPVTIVQPACKVIIQPNSHNAGRARAMITSDASFSVWEKR